MIIKYLFLTILISVIAGSVQARTDSVHTVYAPVTRIDPVFVDQAPIDERCNAPKPPASAGLGALLAWELAPCNRNPQQISHYRVYYRWDGRTYSQTMPERPEHSIPLTLKIR